MIIDPRVHQLALLDGWEASYHEGRPCYRRGVREATWGKLIPSYLTDLNAVANLRDKVINTLELRVDYMNALHQQVAPRCPLNKVGQHVVSDYDKLTATAEDHCIAILAALKIDANVKDQASEGLPASACSTRCCEVCREPFSELSEELQGELRELFESVKTCAKCCQQKLQEAYERTMVD